MLSPIAATLKPADLRPVTSRSFWPRMRSRVPAMMPCSSTSKRLANRFTPPSLTAIGPANSWNVSEMMMTLPSPRRRATNSREPR